VTPGKPATPRKTRTEERIVVLLRRSPGALDTATIARRLRLHPNGVRLQLQRLEGSGLVQREQAREGVGRPRDLWRLAPRAIAEADLPHTGWAMARSLARAIPATPERLREVEAAGVQMGHELAGELDAVADPDPREALDHALGALGFEPRRADDGDRSSFVLRTCPYAEAVRENPAVVCTLHKGVVRGVLERMAPGTELTGFVPKDPDEAGCLVEIRVSGPDA
jgi:predicted ArsR family transcriptional regulator